MEVKDAIRGLKVGKAPGSKVYGTGLWSTFCSGP
jgi:hypothetical protein